MHDSDVCRLVCLSNKEYSWFTCVRSCSCANFTSCATRTTRKAPFWQLCSQFQSAANEMLFYQLHHLYKSYTWQDPPHDNFAQSILIVSNEMLFCQLHHSYTVWVEPLDRTPLTTTLLTNSKCHQWDAILQVTPLVPVEPLDRAPPRQLCSQILSVSNEMLFHQLYLYDSCKSNHLTGLPLYTCLMRCSHAMYFTLLHSNISHSPLEPTAQTRTTRVLILQLEQVVSIGPSSTLVFTLSTNSLKIVIIFRTLLIKLYYVSKVCHWIRCHRAFFTYPWILFTRNK